MAGKEVDDIVLFNLKSIGAAVGDDIKSIADFDNALFFHACSACIKAILQSAASEEVPMNLPKVTSRRWKACTQLSDCLKDAGYPKEIAYEQFMYTKLDEMKRVLLWLVNALPQKEGEDDAVADNIAGLPPYETAMAAIRDLATLTAQKKTRKLKRIDRETAAPYLPGEVASLATSTFSQPFCISTDEAERAYFAEKIPYYPQQMAEDCNLCPSLLEYNSAKIGKEKDEESSWTAKGIYSGVSQKEWATQQATAYAANVDELLKKASTKYQNQSIADLLASLDTSEEPLQHHKKSRFAKDVEFSRKDDDGKTAADIEKETEDLSGQVDSAEARRKAQQAEEENLKEKVQKLERKLQKMDAQLAAMEDEVVTAKKSTTAAAKRAEELAEEGEELEQQFETQKKTFSLADDVEGSKKALLDEQAGVQAEIDAIMAKFSTKESKYRAEYEAVTADQDAAKRELQNLLDDVKEMKGKGKTLTQEIKTKEDHKAALEAEYAKLPKNIDRELFVSRIMDIIKNIKKQQNEITKINIDNRELQKEINNTNEAVERSFVATDEKIWKDATKDDVAKKVYKQLVALRDAFDKLVNTVEETGNIKQQQHELEERKSKMTARDDDLNMEHLQKDLENIKAENAQLAAELKALKGK
eukprot:TRINITY_DN66575_c5_g1_i1.p1 TRINITY_DN66575_c5_g1~~TRINITY_DN66575_c5_g1_i1.p1  ORF type:complete len:644 (-),score=127.15 TRINITY_DN66575_c5_g1_i1:1339-3270(-)